MISEVPKTAVVEVLVVLSVVVVSSEVVEVVVEEPPSLLLFLAQEIMVRLKRDMEKMMSICLTWFPISGLGELDILHKSVCYARIGEVSANIHQ